MPLRKYYMHMTQQTYEEVAEGIVRVTNRDGKTGVFRWSGEWIEGAERGLTAVGILCANGEHGRSGERVVKVVWAIQ